MPKSNRRKFLKASTLAGAGFLISGTKSSGNIIGANDRVRIAVAGLNGRGQSHIKGWLGEENVELAYVADPDENVLNRAVAGVSERTKGKSVTIGIPNIGAALDDKTVDAISVATPNHWHSLLTIRGAQAGKHVYVEKPMSHDVGEGRVAVAAQQKYGVVIQHGTQRRSDKKIAGLTEAIQAGKFGRLKVSYGYCCKPRNTIGQKPITAPPKNLDWDTWRGPAMIDDFHENYVHYNWHWFWKTGNGDLNNQGTHQLDVARWAIDADQTHPVKAMAIGNRFQWDDQGETPNTMFGMAEYPNGQQVFFNVRNVNYDGYERQVENEYYFEDGGRIVRGKYYAKGDSTGEPIKVDDGHVTPGGNWGAFIAAVRANDPGKANGNVYDAHYGCVLGHLMNNSYRLGTKAPFNASTDRFGDNTDAAEHFLKLHDVMHDGVGLPSDGSEYIVGPWLTFDPATELHTGNHAAAANALLKDENRKGYEVPTVESV